MTRRYWVSREDGEDMGDYAGFSVSTLEEAESLVEEQYQLDRDDIERGYYDADFEIPVLTIEVLELLETIRVEP